MIACTPPGIGSRCSFWLVNAGQTTEVARFFPSLSERENSTNRSKQQIKTYLSRKCIANMAIDNELFLLILIVRWYIFKRPVVMPTGTRHNWSSRCHPATENDAFIPMQIEEWLCYLRNFQERNTSLFKNPRYKGTPLCILSRCAPNIPLVATFRRKNTCCHMCTESAPGAEKKNTPGHSSFLSDTFYSILCLKRDDEK